MVTKHSTPTSRVHSGFRSKGGIHHYLYDSNNAISSLTIWILQCMKQTPLNLLHHEIMKDAWRVVEGQIGSDNGSETRTETE